jgi:serine/threonine protein kinase
MNKEASFDLRTEETLGKDESLTPERNEFGGKTTTKTFNPKTPPNLSDSLPISAKKKSADVDTNLLSFGQITLDFEDPNRKQFAFFPLNPQVAKTIAKKFASNPEISYQFLSKIGNGTFGSVVLVLQNEFLNPIVLKMIKIPFGENPINSLEVELEELKFVADMIIGTGLSPNFGISHYGAVVNRRPFEDSQFAEFLPENNSIVSSNLIPIIAMEFADAGTLESSSIIPNEKDTKSVIAQLLFGLDAMNRVGMYHKDITSGNIALTKGRKENGNFTYVLQDEDAAGNRDGEVTFFEGSFSELVPLFIDFGLSENDGRPLGKEMFSRPMQMNLGGQVTSLFSRAPELMLDFEKNQPLQKRGKYRYNPLYNQESEVFSLGMALLAWIFGDVSGVSIRDAFFSSAKSLEFNNALTALKKNIARQCLEDAEFTKELNSSKEGERTLPSSFYVFVCRQESPEYIAFYLLALIALNGIPNKADVSSRETGALSPLGIAMADSQEEIKKLFKGEEDVLKNGLLSKISKERRIPANWRGALSKGRTEKNFQFDAIPLLAKMVSWDRKKRGAPNEILMKEDLFSGMRNKNANTKVGNFFYGEPVAKRRISPIQSLFDGNELGKRKLTDERKPLRVDTKGKRVRLIQNGRLLDVENPSCSNEYSSIKRLCGRMGISSLNIVA